MTFSQDRFVVGEKLIRDCPCVLLSLPLLARSAALKFSCIYSSKTSVRSRLCRLLSG